MVAMQPNYEAHYLDIYQDFAVTYLKLTSDLDILLYVETNVVPSLSDSQLASWIPRWNHGNDINSHLFITGRKVGTAHFVLDGLSLRVQAVILSSVEYISERIKPIEEEPDAFGQVLDLWEQLQVSQKLIENWDAHPHQGHLSLAFLQVINCGIYDGSIEEWVESLKEFAQLLQDTQSQPPSDTSSVYGNPRKLSRFGTSISKSRRFILLGRGNFGLAPNTTQLGDVCAIVYGTSWPLFLRKVVGRKHQYKIIGPAYILSRSVDEYGVPDRLCYNEMCEDWRDWDLPNQEITLC